MYLPSKDSLGFKTFAPGAYGFTKSEYRFYRYTDIVPGYGYCLTTYMSEGTPPPYFKSDPLLLPLQGNAEQIANNFWYELNQENRISLAVRELTQLGEDRLKIINRYQLKSKKK